MGGNERRELTPAERTTLAVCRDAFAHAGTIQFRGRHVGSDYEVVGLLRNELDEAGLLELRAAAEAAIEQSARATEAIREVNDRIEAERVAESERLARYRQTAEGRSELVIELLTEIRDALSANRSISR